MDNIRNISGLYSGLMLVSIIAGVFSLIHAAMAANTAQGSVARAVFTTTIKDREPLDQVLSLSNRQDVVFYFSDLRNFQGQTVTHKWYYENELVNTVEFKVKGPRWRVFSKSAIEPQQIGKWKVVVYGNKNWPVKASIFNVVDGNAEQVILPYKR